MADVDEQDPAVNNHVNYELQDIEARNKEAALRKDERKSAEEQLKTGFFHQRLPWSHPTRVKARNQYNSSKSSITGGKEFDWAEWRRQNGKKSPGQGDAPENKQGGMEERNAPTDDLSGSPIDAGEDIGDEGAGFIGDIFDVF